MSLSNIDQLDALFAQKPSKPKHEDKAMSWREWRWRETDKMLDEFRLKAGKRPLPPKMRAEALEKHLRYENDSATAKPGDQDSD